MNLFKKIIRKIIEKIGWLFAKEEKNLPVPDRRIENFIKIIDEGYGNKQSFLTQKPVNSLGEPIPWFTYPSIQYLSQLDLRGKSMLEWGIGNSTLFFANRCEKIISIEHNSDWYNLISPQLPNNSKGFLVDEIEYATFPTQLHRKFDIIIVDGIQRFDCLKTAVNILQRDGMIIFDNSDRNPEYCSFLREQNLIEIDFHGFGPIVNFTTTTSVFLTRTANFKPLTIQPVIPIGGGY